MLRSLWAFRQLLGSDVEQRAVLAETDLAVLHAYKLHLNGLGGRSGQIATTGHVTSDAAWSRYPAAPDRKSSAGSRAA